MRRLLLVALLLAACSADEPPPPAEPAPEGRAETQSIRNTEAVGYSGNAIADQVDAGLKANEEQVRKAEEESTEEPSE
jgi:hypothetical protein